MKDTFQSHCSFFVSVINQSSRPYCHAVIFSIMQHCLSAQGQFIVYLLSTVEPPCSPMSPQPLQLSLTDWRTIWLSNWRRQGHAYGSRTNLTDSVTIGTQQAGCKSINGPSWNLTFIAPDKTRRCDEWRWRDITTMMRPVVIGSLQPWHSSPNLAQ